MPLHEHFDLAASARASFDFYSIPEEIDALAVGLREVVRVFDREPGRPG
jgi:selenocysteine lyase/cysteine desulfurase